MNVTTGVAAGNDPETPAVNRPPSLRDNANAALFLASDESAYLSGLTVRTTDGKTLSRVAMAFEEDGAAS